MKKFCSNMWKAKWTHHGEEEDSLILSKCRMVYWKKRLRCKSQRVHLKSYTFEIVFTSVSALREVFCCLGLTALLPNLVSIQIGVCYSLTQQELKHRWDKGHKINLQSFLLTQIVFLFGTILNCSQILGTKKVSLEITVKITHPNVDCSF